MDTSRFLPLGLGLTIFSFFISALLFVPFIDYLYAKKFLRLKQGHKGLGKKASLFDKLHDKKAGVPTGGGILVVLATSVMFYLLFPFASRMGVLVRSSYNFPTELFVILFTFLGFGVIGFLDDYAKIFGKPKPGNLGAIYGLSKKQKFSLQWFLAFIISYILYSRFNIHILNIPILDYVLDLGIWYIPFAAFVIVAFTNAVNFTDGLDGLATGLLVICLLAFQIIAATNLDIPLSAFISIWIGSLIAFLYFNVHPARIIMGDVGALAFGAALAVIGLITGNIIALLVIGGIFVVEAVSSVIQILGWKFLHRPIFPIAPFHHTLEALGWEETKIVMRAWIVGILLAIFGLWLATI
jgi:phospho-N-acetylmuramoyl-pentapeptide-transferase